MSKIITLNISTDNVDSRLEGETFQKMMDLCFAKATSFSLSRYGNPGIIYNIERLLMPYKIKELMVNDWFGYMGMEKPIRVFLYQANENTKHIIKNHYTDIFLNCSCFNDLCFFKGKQMFLGTVSHELICAVNLLDESFEQEVLPLTKWIMDSKATFGILKEYL